MADAFLVTLGARDSSMSGHPTPVAVTNSSPLFPMLDEGDRDPAIGHVLAGKYRIEHLLGEGGMGRVYLARAQPEQTPVAIKVLVNAHAVERAAERFFREAEATASIGHENIVGVFDFGQTAEGDVFIVMEYLEGEDLCATLDRVGRMPWQRATHIVLHLCAALGAAHEKGVVHRDVKPENCLRIQHHDDADFIKVLDFGIAKLSRPTPANRRLTRTGSIFGTPAYMSPEQARGRDIDHRADIYSVGVILYELIVGRPPYDGEEFLDIALQHLHKPVVGPGAVLPAGSLPSELDDIVMRAMAKERDQRFPSMREMSGALQKLLDADSGETAPEVGTVPYATRADFRHALPTAKAGLDDHQVAALDGETAEFTRRSRGPALVAVAAVVLLLAGIAWWQLGSTGAPAPKPSTAQAVSPDRVDTRTVPEGAPEAGEAEPKEAPRAPEPPVDEDSPPPDATPAAAEPADAPARAPKKPSVLTPAQISAVLGKHQAALGFCRGGVTTSEQSRVKIKLRIDGATGKVSKVSVDADDTGTEVCVRDVLKRARFPKFAAPTYTLRRTLRL